MNSFNLNPPKFIDPEYLESLTKIYNSSPEPSKLDKIYIIVKDKSLNFLERNIFCILLIVFILILLLIRFFQYKKLKKIKI